MKTQMVPKKSPDTRPELAPFLLPFAPLFRQASSHRELSLSVTGRMPDLPCKNCETIANTSLGHLQQRFPDATSCP